MRDNPESQPWWKISNAGIWISSKRQRASPALCSWAASPRSRLPCQSAVANKLRLLRHSPPVLEALRAAGLTERHARALLKLPQEEQKLAAIAVIVERGLTVARTERYIEELLAQAAHTPRPPKAPDVRGFLSSLTQSLALIQSAGIAAISHQQETDREITLTITIPKEVG